MRLWIFYPHLPRRWTGAFFCVFSVIVGPKVPWAWGHRPQPTLSSLWAPLEGLRTGPWDGLHKVVGDLPLVLKQVFNLCTVCVTYKEKKEHQWQKRGEIKMLWDKGKGLSVLTCMTSIHVSSVAIIFAPTSHDVVHKVRLSHVHGGVDFHLKYDTITHAVDNKHWFNITTADASDLMTCSCVLHHCDKHLLGNRENLSLCCSHFDLTLYLQLARHMVKQGISLLSSTHWESQFNKEQLDVKLLEGLLLNSTRGWYCFYSQSLSHL